MSCLLNYSFNKDYYEYSNIIYNNLCLDKFTNKKILFNSDVKLTNPFNRLFKIKRLCLKIYLI